MTATDERAKVDHPLAALTADDVTVAVEVAKATGRLIDKPLFAYVGIQEPDKETVRNHTPGDPFDRQLRLVIVNGPDASVIEAVVSVTERAVRSWEVLEGTRPALLIEEAIRAIRALRESPDWQAALARRGIVDVEQVQIDPWPAGSFGVEHEEGRRISRCLPYYREDPTDNGYARPVEGLIGFVDMGRSEVLEIVDYGVVPLPPGRGRYFPEDHEPLRTDLKPLNIEQPEGPSFTVEGNLVRWQKWSFRVTMDPYEGLVLHTLGYEDQGRVRPILHRAAVSEMVVPYGDPGPMHGWKNAFDAGEWGLGRMANSLTLGCDCLGVIHYFDAVYADERGRPHTLENAICMHEEDYGILWKHLDMNIGRAEVRRSRRLVISSIATVGNYEYGFYWYLYLDGTIQLEVKLTGIMSTQAVAPGDDPSYATVVAPGLAAPYHQHLFNVRLDMDVDGPLNRVYEVESRPVPPGPDNPWANAFTAESTLLASEKDATRLIEPQRSRYWKVVNPKSTNALGQPVAYKLVPGPTPTLLADPESSVGKRGRFATANLWVTKFAPGEQRAAGDHPNQHEGLDGLPRWTAADRSLVDEDVVLWHTFGVTHIPRPEDWPVMPVEYTGFHLVPVGFFDANPALDVPPNDPHCSGG
ncbi:MAG TPA: primary-amine oxidase [Acidimicrobiales bacterium]|nr:primary-amine oxidase [Acidimicrobiales bacterium]